MKEQPDTGAREIADLDSIMRLILTEFYDTMKGHAMFPVLMMYLRKEFNGPNGEELKAG